MRFLDLVTGEVPHGAPDATTARSCARPSAPTGGTAVTARRGQPRDRLGRQAGGGRARRSRATPGRSPDWRSAATAARSTAPSLDGKVLIWDLAGDRRLGRPFDIGPGASRVDPIGRRSSEPRAEPRRPGPRRRAARRDRQPDRRPDAAHALEVPRRPDGAGRAAWRTCRAAGCSSSAATTASSPWSTRAAARSSSALRGHRGTLVRAPSFSADGRLMATATSATPCCCGRCGPVDRSAVPGAYFTSSWIAGGVSLSPDGRTLAVAAELGVEIVDVATLRLRTIAAARSESVWLAHASRRTGASSSAAATRAGRGCGPPRRGGRRPGRLAGHTGEVLWQSTSPDGRTLATGSTDGTIRLFDLAHPAAARRAAARPCRTAPSRPSSRPTARTCSRLTDAGRAYRWDVRPSSWARHACAVAGRTLTRSEWNDALPGRDYAPACG